MAKPTLADLMTQNHIYMGKLAHASGISSLIVREMFLGKPVSREDAKQIIEGLNKLCGTNYTMGEIAIPLQG